MVGTITEPHVQLGAGTIFAVSRSLASPTMAVRPGLQRHRENSNELNRTLSCGKP
jgi:hypothetical protein